MENALVVVVTAGREGRGAGEEQESPRASLYMQQFGETEAH
jgi:hypothetical protein